MNQKPSKRTHKNKSLASLLALLFGALGLHRFYLRGMADRWGWLHLLSLPASGLLIGTFSAWPLFFGMMPLILSALAGILEALTLGLMPDDKWDAKYNPESGRRSESGWPLALLLVLAVGVGATGLIATIARSFDLFFTGGAFG